jgi:hypothetical protein
MKAGEFWYDYTWPGYINGVPLPPDLNPALADYYETLILNRIGCSDNLRKILKDKFRAKRAKELEESLEAERKANEEDPMGLELHENVPETREVDEEDFDQSPVEYRGSRSSGVRK